MKILSMNIRGLFDRNATFAQKIAVLKHTEYDIIFFQEIQKVENKGFALPGYDLYFNPAPHAGTCAYIKEGIKVARYAPLVEGRVQMFIIGNTLYLNVYHPRVKKQEQYKKQQQQQQQLQAVRRQRIEVNAADDDDDSGEENEMEPNAEDVAKSDAEYHALVRERCEYDKEFLLRMDSLVDAAKKHDMGVVLLGDMNSVAHIHDCSAKDKRLRVPNAVFDKPPPGWSPGDAVDRRHGSYERQFMSYFLDKYGFVDNGRIFSRLSGPRLECGWRSYYTFYKNMKPKGRGGGRHDTGWKDTAIMRIDYALTRGVQLKSYKLWKYSPFISDHATMEVEI